MSVQHDTRVVLYPAYIDADKSCSQGRRIPKAAAVVMPDAREMVDAVSRGLQLEVELEGSKAYSRDALQPGRIKVRLRGRDGELLNKDIPNKHTLMVECADFCSRHPQRDRRIAEVKRFEENMYASLNPAAAQIASAAKGATSGSGAAAAAPAGKDRNAKGSNKKKGKRK